MHLLLQARQPLLGSDSHRLGSNKPASLSKISRLLVAAGAIALLASCATTDNRPADVEVRDISTEEPDGEAYAYEDDPVLIASDVEPDENSRQASRAEYYQRQAAQQSDLVEQINATLSSAEYFIQANQHQRAAELVLSVRDSISTLEQRQRAIVVLAYADYANADYQQALLRLDSLLNSESLEQSNSDNDDDSQPDYSETLERNPNRNYIDANKGLVQKERLSTQQVDALLLASFCYQALGDYEASIIALIRRESALFGAARAETTRYIWQVINGVPVEQRELIMQQSSNPQLRNRVQQSLGGQIGLSTQSPQQFNQWREELTPNAPSNLVEAEWGPNSPRSIYVLLPLSSRFGKAAQAVKAGLEREHGLNQSAYRPNLSYYDIGDNPLQIGQYYAAAVRAGADFIIGPIGRTYSNEANSSSAYFGGSSYGSQAPMLMLGGDQMLSSGNLRLSMSPEVEGQLVAERAWQDGHLSAGVLSANSERSRRVLAGFSQRWLSLGGKLGQTIEYSSQQFDHSTELKQLFAINASEYRHRQLSRILGTKPKFSPYQRGDIDFVLMVANNKTGRIVRPQINFFTNSQLPVYATSSIYNGIEDKINNMDLDGTRFPVMPWVVRSGKATQYAGQLNMLQAMGMDAYRVAGSLSTLRGSANTAISGNTGQLMLQRNGEIIYQPAWAKFENGEVHVIDSKGVNITPLEGDNTEGGIFDGAYKGKNGAQGRASNKYSNSKGSYNEQNWDPRESRRKTGG